MTTFKIIEEVLGRSWCRYYYEVPAETKEEAMEKVKEKEDIDCYNLEELFEFGHQDVDPMDNDGNRLEKSMTKNGILCGITPR